MNASTQRQPPPLKSQETRLPGSLPYPKVVGTEAEYYDNLRRILPGMTDAEIDEEIAKFGM